MLVLFFSTFENDTVGKHFNRKTKVNLFSRQYQVIKMPQVRCEVTKPGEASANLRAGKSPFISQVGRRPGKVGTYLTVARSLQLSEKLVL